MATSGQRPKTSAELLIENARRTTRHGSESELRDKFDKSTSVFGKLGPMPPHFTPDDPAEGILYAAARLAWARYIMPAWWMDASKEPAAIAFCELWQEFCDSPKSFSAAKHGQLRAYMNELGLTDERNRGGDPPEQTDEFFDD